ncbi:MAG: flagellar biosynthetic protein FliO [Candidatus Melainabacteria bacterium LEY3_CP_29_8]|nr:MAG: flagellar biosynthetic protein FliO [Candidatus Melainabacteria bacterium LEY3_CP_29_8]
MVDALSITKIKLIIKNIILSPDVTYILQAFMSLALVIGLIYLSAYIYKKLTNVTSTKINKTKEDVINKNKLNIISSLPLGSNKSLYVVEVSGKTLLLGVCENNISLIKELGQDEPIFENKKNVCSKNLNNQNKENNEEQNIKTNSPSKDDLNELIRICNKYL